MSDDIIEETDTFRLIIEPEVYPEQPDYDGMGMILRMDGYRFEAVHVEKTPSLAGEFEQGWRRWGDMAMIERWLRLFYDVVGFDYFDTQDAKYVCVVTQEELETWGFSSTKAYELRTGRDNPADGVLRIWQAYVEGECYSFVIQEKQRWLRLDGPNGTVDDLGDDRVVRESWETVEAIGGFYGYEDAEQSGREMFATYTEKDE